MCESRSLACPLQTPEATLDVETFLKASHVLVVVGKGGTGRTTVSAALADLALSHGLRTLIVSIDGRPGLGARLGGPEPVGYAPVELRSQGEVSISGRTIAPDAALGEWLDTHGLGRIGKRMAGTGTLELVATAVPGIKDVLVLGKIRALEASGDFDLIVVDAPASGHARTFLASAKGVLDTATSGAIHGQASAVVEMLTDHERCATVVVSIPEETPVNETGETLAFLEGQGIAVNAVVMNMVVPFDELLTTPVADSARAASVSLGQGAIDTLERVLSRQRSIAESHATALDRLSTLTNCAPLTLPFLLRDPNSRKSTQLLAAALERSIEELEGSP